MKDHTVMPLSQAKDLKHVTLYAADHEGNFSLELGPVTQVRNQDLYLSILRFSHVTMPFRGDEQVMVVRQ
jgi:hypothetical protein